MMGFGGNQQPFSVVCEQRGHAAHLRLCGEIDLATSPILEQQLGEAEEDVDEIRVDLGQVTFMDVSGLRVFLRAAERARGDGRTFAVAQASAVVRHLLHLTGTTHLLSPDAPLSRNPEGTRLGRPSSPPVEGRAIATEDDVTSSEERPCVPSNGILYDEAIAY